MDAIVDISTLQSAVGVNSNRSAALCFYNRTPVKRRDKAEGTALFNDCCSFNVVKRYLDILIVNTKRCRPRDTICILETERCETCSPFGTPSISR